MREPEPEAHRSGPQWTDLASIEGRLHSGESARSRLRLHGEESPLLEGFYPAGVSSPEHSRPNDGYVDLLRGDLTGTLNREPIELPPGQTPLHPVRTRHSAMAVADSHWLEFHAPPELRA